MSLLLWTTIAFIVIGFGVLLSMKKRMERKVVSMLENEEIHQTSNQPVISWIFGVVIWAIVSMFLIVLSFSI